MIDWIKIAQGVAATVAAMLATMVACATCLPRLVFLPGLAPIHARIAALEQFNRDSRLLVLTQPGGRQSARHAPPEMDAMSPAQTCGQ